MDDANQRGSRGKALFYVVIFLMMSIGIGALLLNFYMYFQDKKLLETHEQTIGTYAYSETEEYVDSEGITRTRYYPMVKYIINGLEYISRVNYGFDYEPDSSFTVTIYYNPDDLTDIMLGGFNIVNPLLIFGVLFAVVPILILMRSNNRLSPSKQDLTWGGGFALIGICSIAYLMPMYMKLSWTDLLYELPTILIPVMFVSVGIYLMLRSSTKE